MGRRSVERLLLPFVMVGCGPSIATTSAGTEGDSTGMRETDDVGTTSAGSTDQTSSVASSGSSPSTDDSTSGGASDSTTGTAIELAELRIEPAYAILDSAVGGQMREFTAIGVTDDGEEIDVTQLVEWSLEGPGSLEDGILTSPESDDPVFERARLTVEVDGLNATAFAAISVRTQATHAPQLFNLNIDPSPKQLDYRPLIESVDVFFLIDTVSWVDEEYLIPYHDRIINLIVPQLESEGLDLQFGAGRFSAFPVEGNGQETCGNGQGDQPFELWSEMSPDIADLENGLAPAELGAPVGCLYSAGSIGEALYQVATGEGLDGPGPTFVEANPGIRGGVGFREHSLALVLTTGFDSLNTGLEHLPPPPGEAASVAHTANEIFEAFRNRDILHMGQTGADIFTSGLGLYHAMAQLSADTGAVVPPAAWNHPELGRPANCAPDECCVDRSDGYQSEISPYCPLTSRYRLDDDPFEDPADNIRRDLYALTHYLLTDVSTTVVGESASVSGVPLRDDVTTDTFIDLTLIDADDPPLEGMPTPVLEDNVWTDVSPNTNLNYEVTVNPDAVPSLPGEPLLYRVSVSLQTGYRAGSVIQEYWIVSPPAEN